MAEGDTPQGQSSIRPMAAVNRLPGKYVKATVPDTPEVPKTAHASPIPNKTGSPSNPANGSDENTRRREAPSDRQQRTLTRSASSQQCAPIDAQRTITTIDGLHHAPTGPQLPALSTAQARQGGEYWRHRDEYERDIGDTQSNWEEFKAKFDFGLVFEQLQGHEKQRYAKLLLQADEKKRLVALEEDTVEALLSTAAKTLDNHNGNPFSNSKHTPCSPTRKAPGFADLDTSPSQSMTPRARGRPRKHPPKLMGDEKTVTMGVNEFKRYREYYRPEYKKKEDVQTAFVYKARVFGTETKVFSTLLDDPMYMGYLPGEYILRYIGRDDIGDDENNVQQLHRRGVAITRSGQLVAYVLGEGTVPFTKEQCYGRFEEVFPAIVNLIVAFLGFNPEDPEQMEPTLKSFWAKPKTELAKVDISYLEEMWRDRFKNTGRPNFMATQYLESRSKLWEAAWLLCELQRQKVELKPGWSDLEGFLKFMSGGVDMAKLATYYTGVWLRDEAIRCIQEGYPDEVLIYDPRKQAGKIKNSHEFYRGVLVFPQPAPFDTTRLKELREAAIRVVTHQPILDDLILQNRAERAEREEAAREAALWNNYPWSNLPVPADRASGDQVPYTNQQLASARQQLTQQQPQQPAQQQSVEQQLFQKELGQLARQHLARDKLARQQLAERSRQRNTSSDHHQQVGPAQRSQGASSNVRKPAISTSSNQQVVATPTEQKVTSAGAQKQTSLIIPEEQPSKRKRGRPPKDPSQPTRKRAKPAKAADATKTIEDSIEVASDSVSAALSSPLPTKTDN
ncbi:uncharacterized protein BCR38DRAFT_239682 [Pseudomassariella vexata]|uniref:Uncharacterized protein n=1 Tax=Pseudomassariella vexata TaxID=1141098 RepID=A0A1Y2DUV6_9PEZI|nr:uncharacterized protein BCR38DRAFT_239682 [Pseudomassariella vexata]ORY62435.1 hypothetical protein BCR38DRAFT_239682 [Pseudomassariella vexata]